MESRGVIDTVVDRAVGGAGMVFVEQHGWVSRDVGGISRLDVSDELQDVATDWDAVDREIRAAFAALARRVQTRVPGLRWKWNSYRSSSIKLASYAIFYRADGDDFDPIYVGLTVSAKDSRVRVSGDISGDESGQIYFDRGCELMVEDRRMAIIDATQEVAGRLAAEYQVVVEAINVRPPGADLR